MGCDQAVHIPMQSASRIKIIPVKQECVNRVTGSPAPSQALVNSLVSIYMLVNPSLNAGVRCHSTKVHWCVKSQRRRQIEDIRFDFL